MILKPTELNHIKPHVYCSQQFTPLLESSVTMYYSHGGTGKSYAAIKAAIEFVIETKQKALLWLSEDPEGENRSRFYALVDNCYADHKELLEENIHFITEVPVRFTELSGGNCILTKNFWRARELFQEYGLVCFDPLLQFNGGDENSNVHAGVLMGGLKEWAVEENKVILLLHHASKSRENAHFPRGATEWGNGCRAVYYLERIIDELHDKTTVLNANHINNIMFTLTKNNGVGAYFRNQDGQLKKVLEVFAGSVDYQPTIPQIKPFLSIAHHGSLTIPSGYQKQEIEFEELHKIVTAGHIYSQFQFQNGYRKGVNNLGNMTMLCLDYDDGSPTLDEAKEIYKDYKALLITTKSHQKEKGDKPACDRFRVILEFDTPVTAQVSQYNALLSKLYAYAGAVDPSTKDLARCYFSSPADAEFFYTGGTEKVDWSNAYKQVKRDIALDKIQSKLKQFVKPKTTYKKVKSSNGPQQNTLPASTEFRTELGVMTFHQLRDLLTEDAKITCYCRDGIDHGGAGPGHHSGFIKKTAEGNVFYSCSGGRCADVGTLWCEDIEPAETTSQQKETAE